MTLQAAATPSVARAALPPPFDTAERIALVAHDAGGAEILSALALAYPDKTWHICVQGPAQAVFARKLPGVASLPPETVLQQVQAVICGTGWQSRLEWAALQAAQRKGLPSAAFLDHWVNYASRFVRDGVYAWPTQIWVGDSDALPLAQAMLAQMDFSQQPTPDLQLLPNPYCAAIRAQFARLRERAPEAVNDSPHHLFISEPIAAHAEREFGNPRHWGYTEFDALERLIAHLPAGSHLIIRPHPAEPADKYSAWLDRSQQEHRLHISIDAQTPLFIQIAAANTVYGCNSMALVVALLADKPVVCCIPPGGAGCVLPQEGIQRF